MESLSKFNLYFRLIFIGVILVISLASSAAELDQAPDLQLVQVDGSSIWLAKFQYDRFKAGVDLPANVEMRGEITKADIPVFKALLAPFLGPRYLQTHQKPLWFKSDPDESTFMVFLDSQGGDVKAALELGRLFRKARVTSVVGKYDKCLSSCVFLLAGSVRRFIFGQVGIHRPYLNDTAPRTFESLQNHTTHLSGVVSTYLKEMNIPSVLFDDMMRVPSEQTKMLDSSDLDLYGLNNDDPVFAELQRQAEARVVGLSISDYLSRKAAYDRCVYSLFEQRIKEGKVSVFDDMEGFSRGKNECLDKYILKKSQP